MIALPAIGYHPCLLHIGYHMVHRLIILLHHIFMISQQHMCIISIHNIKKDGNSIPSAVNHIPQYKQRILIL